MITDKGFKFLIILIISSFLSVLTPTITLVAITLISILLLDYLTLVRKKVLNLKFKAEVIAGEKLSFDLPPLGEFVNQKFVKFENKGSKVEAIIDTRFFGKYVLKPKVVLKSFLGLFSVVKDSGIEIDLTIYPRFLREVILALGELYGIGGLGYYKLSPRGLEYVESREYIEGDLLNRIDFNATAKTGTLHIKYFLDEGSLGEAIIFDIRSPGRYTADYLASKFLSAILNSDRSIVLITDGVKTYRYEGNRDYILKIALYWVFRIALDKGEEIYEIVPPKIVSELEKVLKVNRGNGTTESPYKLSYEMREVIVIAHPLYDTVKLLRFLADAKSRGIKVKVIYPESPWLDSEDLERAYIEYQSFRKVTKVIEDLVEG
ncbi:DUF58 domain-containing protein [Saccharolobus islandicus]|uniref:Uncharacterized protein n=1 Tax=Saccharolobus islandicus LAL14/1 TaxID=1241935 RepID=M9UCM4_SACIS|nr:DUF58 domain-containing protein [Sulfolobus islandicus]AGJ62286.1 Hypothetical Protein SiL_0831 [Sulfolobus islandicus LAL14/1]